MSLSLQGNRKSWGLPAGARPAERKPTAYPLTSIFAFVRKAAVKSARFLVRASEAFAEARMHKTMIEVELYRNRYVHGSKNDDELPIVGSVPAPAPADQSTSSVSPRVALKRAADAVIEIVRRAYPAIVVLSLLATVLAGTMALRLAIWLPLYRH
jgi:hypothetical protein